jgi:hypothetical protein
MRSLIVAAALTSSKRAEHVSLSTLTVEEKHASLLLLLLQLKDAFVKPHVNKCCILQNITCPSPVYTVHATLLCNSAMKLWSPEALDKFLIGDVGATHGIIAFVQSH